MKTLTTMKMRRVEYDNKIWWFVGWDKSGHGMTMELQDLITGEIFKFSDPIKVRFTDNPSFRDEQINKIIE